MNQVCSPYKNVFSPIPKIAPYHVVTNVANNVYALIDMPYKLIRSSSEIKLFNLIEDPKEQVNIANENILIVDELIEKLNDWPIGLNR